MLCLAANLVRFSGGSWLVLLLKMLLMLIVMMMMVVMVVMVAKTDKKTVGKPLFKISHFCLTFFNAESEADNGGHVGHSC